jgi:hypothetical protein
MLRFSIHFLREECCLECRVGVRDTGLVNLIEKICLIICYSRVLASMPVKIHVKKAFVGTKSRGNCRTLVEWLN